MRYRFAEFELDAVGGRLARSGLEVEIRPKVLALLTHLVRCAGRVVPKSELFAEVWPGLRVSDATLASTLRDLRRLLEDLAGEPRFVQTFRGRGLCFVAPVESLGDEAPVEVRPVPPGGDPRFVGRGELLASADGWIAAACAGRGRLGFLVGEAGIGKTRTALELASRARVAGCVVHVGQCLEEEGAPPFRPWCQVLTALLAGREPRELEPSLAGSAVEALASILGEPARGPGAGDAGASLRFALFDAVATLLRAAAREQPRLILLDDLHRADPSSLLLLRHLAHEISDVPVLLLGTYRPAEAGGQLAEILDTLHPPGMRIALSGLAPAEVAALARDISGLDVSARLTAALFARTGGNPLFVEEITRALAAEGALGAADAAERALRAAPEGVRQVILSRIDRLPEGARAALEVAAVIGREFDLPVLERACAAPDAARLRDGVLGAVDAGLVAPLRDRLGGFRFVHILMRDALYDAIASGRRAELHAAVARALSMGDAHEVDARADALAYHFEQAIVAGEGASAALWARRAGERALARAAYDEAAAHATRALRVASVAGVTDARTRAELLLLLGRARWFGGAPEEAREAFRDAGEAARAAGAPDLIARAALGFTGRTDATPGVNRVAVGLLEAALALLPESEPALRAEVMARLGTELYYDPDTRRADLLTQQAVALAERTGDDALLAYALSARHYLLVRPEVEPAERLAVVERVVELAERSESSDVLAIGLQDRIFDLLELGEGLRMENCLYAYERVVERLRQPFFRWVLGFLLGMHALLAGEIGRAERLASETLSLGQALGTPNALSVFSVQLYAIRREQGRAAELQAPLSVLVREQPDLPAFRTGLVAIAGECGRREEARDALRQIVEGDLDRFPRDRNWLISVSALVPGAAICGDAALVRSVYDLLSPYAGRVIGIGHGAACDGSVDHHLGVLAVALGDADLADDHFTAACALHRQLRSPLWVAHTQREQARALWKRGTPGDRERARLLQGEALESYERFGLAHRVAQTRRLGVTA